jgi:hypothetical protein
VYTPYTIPVRYHTKFDVAPRHFRQAAAPQAGVEAMGIVQHEGAAPAWQYGPTTQYTAAIDCDHCCDHVWDGYCSEWHGWCDGPAPWLSKHGGACGGHHGGCGHDGACGAHGGCGQGHGLLRGHHHKHGCDCGACGIEVSAVPADHVPVYNSTTPSQSPALPRNELPGNATSFEGEVASPVVRCSTDEAVTVGATVQASTAPTAGDTALLQMLYGAASTRVASKVCGD